MIARNIISQSIPPLKQTDTGQKALSWMSEFFLQQLPVVDGTQFLGIITEYDILDQKNPDERIVDMPLKLTEIKLSETDHIYEAIKAMQKNKLSILPVVDAQDKYLGIITQESLINFFASASALQEPGGIVVLELNQNDYVLTEIAQIVETNDASILNLYVNQVPNASLLEITLKLNRADLEAIIQAFERYNYSVKAFYQEEDYSEFLQDRYDSLMNYLNI